MAIAAGSRFGPYEILSLLGTGGMGEVYRAHDIRLHREVAIKVLASPLAESPHSRQRFEREAALLAALNHPGIAHVYGFETATLPDGSRAHFIAMELVEGEDLARRLARGPIGVREALALALQVAEALEEAHEKGIVHRDLKPSNVKLTPEGRVKLLDFGLAKAWTSQPPGGSSPADLTEAPTLAHTATLAGAILGTAAYMSPEQARGKSVDKRADVWAFGVVLFEMLTGSRPFGGETVSDTLAAVLRQEIPWPTLPAETPAVAHRLLRRCLERDPRLRLRDVGEARIAIGEALAQADLAADESEDATTARRPARWRRHQPWILAALGVAIAALALRAPWRRPSPSAPSQRLSVELGADVSLDVTDAGPAAIVSPDGGLLAFVGRRKQGERARLFVRRLEQLQAAPLAGTEGAHSPFFSPDGRSIAFFADGRLKRVAIGGGATVVLADAPLDRGGTWSEDGSILFAANGMPGVGLSRVLASGGATEVLTAPDPRLGEATHRWPQALPGGRAVLFTADSSVTSYDDASIVVQVLPHGQRKVVIKGGYHGQYLPSGHVVYVHEGTLFAIAFDLGRLEVAGTAVPVIDELVAAPNTAGAQFAFSNRGTLVYVPGRPPMVSIQWLDQSARLTAVPAASGYYRHLRLSPDGTKVALQAFAGKGPNLLICDLAHGTMSRLTFETTRGAFPVWAPDGRGVAYTAISGGHHSNVYWQRADGTGSPRRLTEGDNLQIATSWHPSGGYLAIQEVNPRTGSDVMILPIQGDEASGPKPGRPTPILNGPYNEGAAAFSPDGHWLAYASNESGRDEVYVRPFPGPGGKWQVSSEGGSYPVWSRSGRELFYETLDQRLMVAPCSQRNESFNVEKPRRWAEAWLPDPRGFWTFDLHPDGKRFVVLQEVPEAERKSDHVVFFQDVFEELRRLAPGK